MKESNNLIVPIHVEALCVGEKDFSDRSSDGLVGALIDFRKLPIDKKNAYLIDRCLAKPFASQAVLPVGLHLHWALPDALTKATIEDSNNQSKLKFPVIPNRWLVTRIWKLDGTEATQRKSWLVESDYLAETSMGQSTAVPNSVSGKPCEFLGRVMECNEDEPWKESETPVKRLEKINTTGVGETTFAAFYPSSSGSLGFHDSLEDFSNGLVNLTYIVVGWHSSVMDDPINKKTPVEIEEVLRWQCTSNSSPERSLYHGIVNNLQWDRSKSYIDDNIEASKVLNIGVGNTVTEALSALLIKKNKSTQLTKNQEELLNLLQSGLLDQIDDLNKLKVDGGSQLHANRFRAKDSGTQWIISMIPKEEKLEPLENTEISERIPKEISNQLQQLNILQLRYDHITDNIQSKRWQIYADWQRYVKLVYESDNIPEMDDIFKNEDLIQKYIQQTVSELNDENNSLKIQSDNLLSQIAKLKEVINQMLIEAHKKENLKENYHLQTVPASRYWQPNDLVILLTGDFAQPSLRHGHDNQDDQLLGCRISTEIITELKESSSGSNILPKLKGINRSVVNVPFSSDVEDLIHESAIANEHPKVFSHYPHNENFLLSGKSHTVKRPASIALNNWDMPWHPIFMEWEVEYSPITYLGPSEILENKEYKLNGFFENCEMAESGDWIGNIPKPQKSSSYRGYSVLTASATKSLQQQIQHYIDIEHPLCEELKEILTLLGDAPILCQSLTGLHEAMMMRKTAPQLPVFDPWPNKNSKLPKEVKRYKFSNETVKQAVDSANNASVSFDAETYNPLRHGYLKIKKLRVVDNFGQYKMAVNDRNANIVCSFTLENEQCINKGDIYLPPRITQPARLDCNWLVEEKSGVPVVGWLIPNLIEQSLTCFTADGKSIGALTKAQEWLSPPGSTHPDQTFEEAVRNLPTGLKQYIEMLSKSNKENFNRIYESIEKTLMSIYPDTQGQHNLASLLFRPLALVGLEISLHLHGLPAYSQHWEAFKKSLESFRANHENPRFDLTDSWQQVSGFTNVQFPIKLGNAIHHNDGLVGFVKTEDWKDFYTTVDKVPELLWVTPNSEKQIYMLMDPHLPVHVTSGFLPEKTIQLSVSDYQDALQRLNVSLFTGPILTPGDKNNLFMPQIEGYEWAWVQHNEVSMLNQKPSEEQASLNYSPQRIREGWLQLLPARSKGEKK